MPVSDRRKVLVGALLAGAFVGLLFPFSVVVVCLAVAVLGAVALGVRAEGRVPPPPIMLQPLPWGLFVGATVLFWLIGSFGLLLGLVLFVVLIGAFVVLGGDLG
jgi:hypothetical protein